MNGGGGGRMRTTNTPRRGVYSALAAWRRMAKGLMPRHRLSDEDWKTMMIGSLLTAKGAARGLELGGAMGGEDEAVCSSAGV